MSWCRSTPFWPRSWKWRKRRELIIQKRRGKSKIILKMTEGHVSVSLSLIHTIYMAQKSSIIYNARNQEAESSSDRLITIAGNWKWFEKKLKRFWFASLLLSDTEIWQIWLTGLGFDNTCSLFWKKFKCQMSLFNYAIRILELIREMETKLNKNKQPIP